MVVPPFIKHTQCFIDARLVSVATTTASRYQQQASFKNSQFNKTASSSLAHHCSNGALQLVTVIIEDRLILPGHSVVNGFEKVAWEALEHLVSGLVELVSAQIKYNPDVKTQTPTQAFVKRVMEWNKRLFTQQFAWKNCEYGRERRLNLECWLKRKQETDEHLVLSKLIKLDRMEVRVPVCCQTARRRPRPHQNTPTQHYGSRSNIYSEVNEKYIRSKSWVKRSDTCRWFISHTAEEGCRKGGQGGLDPLDFAIFLLTS